MKSLKVKLVKLASRSAIGVVRPVSRVPDKRKTLTEKRLRRELREERSKLQYL